MKHRLPKPKNSKEPRVESPVDELGRVSDGNAPATNARRATPPPLPVVNKTSSPIEPPSSSDNVTPFSFLSGSDSPSQSEKTSPEKKEDEPIENEAFVLSAEKTEAQQQKEAEISAKKKTSRFHPPAKPEQDSAPELETAAPAGSGNHVIHGESDLLIQTRGLVKQYGGRRVVNGVDIHVRNGEVVGLLGKNGAGKTTTFYMIVGLVTPTIGHVYMGDEDVTRMPMYRRARRGIGYLPQEESIFRKLTVEENLLAILETLPLTEEQRDARCDELLKDFGLEHVRENVAITLSGGEKRRVTIARALVTNPTLLLLDEPFSGVDPMAVHDIQEIILHLKERGLGVLITDHNVRETLSVVDRAYIIDEGRVLSEGSREFLLNDPIAREIYLGHRFSM
jgi:lipopolysaccharide export system ATP-binding protein